MFVLFSLTSLKSQEKTVPPRQLTVPQGSSSCTHLGTETSRFHFGVQFRCSYEQRRCSLHLCMPDTSAAVIKNMIETIIGKQWLARPCNTRETRQSLRRYSTHTPMQFELMHDLFDSNGIIVMISF